jgi:hypothetical protein
MGVSSTEIETSMFLDWKAASWNTLELVPSNRHQSMHFAPSFGDSRNVGLPQFEGIKIIFLFASSGNVLLKIKPGYCLPSKPSFQPG